MTDTLTYFKVSQPGRAVRWFVKNNGIAPLNENVIQVPDTYTPEYKKKTPYQAVPILELNGGGSLTESAAIINYLATKHGKRAEYPEDPLRTARVHEAQLHHDSLGRTLTVAVFRKLLPIAAGAPLTVAAVRDEIAKSFEASRWTFELLDSILGEQKWIAGNDFTVADYNLICELNQWPILQDAGFIPDAARIESFPNIVRYLRDAKEVPNHDEFIAETVGAVQFLKAKAEANAAAAASATA